MVRSGGGKRARKPPGTDMHMRSLLPAYAAAVTLGQIAQARFPQMAQHLDTCVTCQAELAKLLELIEPIYDGTLEVDKSQTFDLSFLDQPTTLPVQAEPKESSIASRRFGSLDRLVLILDTQLEALRTHWSAASGRPLLLQARGTALIDYEPDPATIGGVGVSVQIYPSDADPQRCDLQLALVLPEDIRAPNGITLILQVDDQIWKETTDESGQFIFAAAIAFDAATLRITAEILP
jgi:hypothetical protein